MSIGVGLMLAGYAVLRRKRTYKAWFKAHILTNTVAVAASIGGLLVGFYMIGRSTGVHLRLPHTWIGLVTLVVAIEVLALGFAFEGSRQPHRRPCARSIGGGWAGVLLMVLMVLMVLTLLPGMYSIPLKL